MVRIRKVTTKYPQLDYDLPYEDPNRDITEDQFNKAYVAWQEAIQVYENKKINIKFILYQMWDNDNPANHYYAFVCADLGILILDPNMPAASNDLKDMQDWKDGICNLIIADGFSYQHTVIMQDVPMADLDQTWKDWILDYLTVNSYSDVTADIDWGLGNTFAQILMNFCRYCEGKILGSKTLAKPILPNDPTVADRVWLGQWPQTQQFYLGFFANHGFYLPELHFVSVVSDFHPDVLVLMSLFWPQVPTILVVSRYNHVAFDQGDKYTQNPQVDLQKINADVNRLYSHLTYFSYKGKTNFQFRLWNDPSFIPDIEVEPTDSNEVKLFSKEWWNNLGRNTPAMLTEPSAFPLDRNTDPGQSRYTGFASQTDIIDLTTVNKHEYVRKIQQYVLQLHEFTPKFVIFSDIQAEYNRFISTIGSMAFNQIYNNYRMGQYDDNPDVGYDEEPFIDPTRFASPLEGVPSGNFQGTMGSPRSEQRTNDLVTSENEIRRDKMLLQPNVLLETFKSDLYGVKPAESFYQNMKFTVPEFVDKYAFDSKTIQTEVKRGINETKRRRISRQMGWQYKPSDLPDSVLNNYSAPAWQRTLEEFGVNRKTEWVTKSWSELNSYQKHAVMRMLEVGAEHDYYQRFNKRYGFSSSYWGYQYENKNQYDNSIKYTYYDPNYRQYGRKSGRWGASSYEEEWYGYGREGY